MTNRQGFLAKIISDNIYLFGFRGTPYHIALMAIKIDSLFEEFDPNLLGDIFDDFVTGTYEFEYQITIVDLSNSLTKRGIFTKKRRKYEEENKKQIEDFYSFQDKSRIHNSRK